MSINLITSDESQGILGALDNPIVTHLNTMIATMNAGGVAGTDEDVTVNLDPVTGDDESGDGSPEHPYETLTRALEDRNPHERNVMRITGPAGVYQDSFPAFINRVASGGGEIVMDFPMVVHPDHQDVDGNGVEYEIDSFSEVGPAGSYVAADLVVAGAPGFAPDALKGLYLRMKDGASQGYIYRITGNTTDTLRLMAWAWTPEVGGKFEIVWGGAEFADTIGVTRGIRMVDLESEPGRTAQNSRLAMIGMRFTGVGSTLSFVDTAFLTNGCDLGDVLIDRCSMNGAPLPDDTAIEQVPLRDMWQLQNGANSMWLIGSYCSLVDCYTWDIFGEHMLTYCSVGEVSQNEGAALDATACYALAPSNKVNFKANGHAHLINCWGAGGGKFATAASGSYLMIQTCEIDPAAYTNAVGVYFGATVRKAGGTMDPTDPNNAVQCLPSNTKIPWPGAGTHQDVDGNNIYA